MTTEVVEFRISVVFTPPDDVVDMDETYMPLAACLRASSWLAKQFDQIPSECRCSLALAVKRGGENEP